MWIIYKGGVEVDFAKTGKVAQPQSPHEEGGALFLLSQSQKKLVDWVGYWIDAWVYLIGYLIGPLLVALEHVIQSNGVTSGFSMAKPKLSSLPASC